MKLTHAAVQPRLAEGKTHERAGERAGRSAFWGVTVLTAGMLMANVHAADKSADTLCRPGMAAREMSDYTGFPPETYGGACNCQGTDVWRGIKWFTEEVFSKNAVAIRKILNAADSDRVVIEISVEESNGASIVSQCLSATCNGVPAGDNATLARATELNLLGRNVVFVCGPLPPCHETFSMDVPPISALDREYPPVSDSKRKAIGATSCSFRAPEAVENHVRSAILASSGDIKRALLGVDTTGPLQVEVILGLDSSNRVTGREIFAMCDGILRYADKLAEIVPGLPAVGEKLDVPPGTPCGLRVLVPIQARR